MNRDRTSSETPTMACSLESSDEDNASMDNESLCSSIEEGKNELAIAG